MHTERDIASASDILKTTVLKLQRSLIRMFSYRYQRIQYLDARDHEQLMDIVNDFFLSDKMVIRTGLFEYYGQTRHISL